jgi:kynurenine 3-monooxygenase
LEKSFLTKKPFSIFTAMPYLNEFLINGAGPVGLSIATLLHTQGHRVVVYEKRPDPRLHDERGRSINLALSERGFRTLDMLGIGESIKKHSSVPMYGRMIHDERGHITFQPYSEKGNCIYSVSRNLLNNLLLDLAEEKNIEIHFAHKCNGYDLPNETLAFENGAISTQGKSILACDGAFSPLRKYLHENGKTETEECVLDYAYKELTIPAGTNNTWQIDKNALHIWPRKSFMLIALPNIEGSFTCTLFLRKNTDNTQPFSSFEELHSPQCAKEFFEKYFHDALGFMPDFEADFTHNPVSDLFTKSCATWNLHDKLLLLGDAAHAIVPFYGQGLNAGLEDARLLSEEILKHNELAMSFYEFQRKRKPDTDAIGQLALQNFIEMRDLVTDKAFLKKRQIETKLKKLYDDLWATQYELVTFSHVPYSKAKEIGNLNEQKLELISENDILTQHLLKEELTEQDKYVLDSLVI